MRASFSFLKSSIWPKWNLESGPTSSFEGRADQHGVGQELVFLKCLVKNFKHQAFPSTNWLRL